MTVQREDVEPENNRATSSVSDWRSDPNFDPPARVPWSELGDQFDRWWGIDDRNRPQPEHLEIVGPTGSGKTYTLCKMLQRRAKPPHSQSSVLVCTKPADSTILKLGWPIVHDWQGVKDERNVIFWPRTKRMGNARRDYHEAAISDLLHRLWEPEANTVVAFDEIGYVESLSGEMKALVQQYWREARSQGITVAGMKQRPQGALRDMHSETYWTVAFAPKDRSDAERFAELFGHRRDWLPVFDSLDATRREFIIRHARSKEAYISWVDEPLVPMKTKRKTPSWWGRGDGRT